MNKALKIARCVAIWIIILVSTCALTLTLAIASYITVQAIQNRGFSLPKDNFLLPHEDYLTNSIDMMSAITTDNTPLVLDKLGSYTTYYATSSAERKHNIALAAQLINNSSVPPTEHFSFNQCVGVRTRERGFQSANIILNGSFVQGVGGGVCQVSTTLYNAWVTSGLAVTSSRAHSLPVSYVPIARDAAVSSQIDLILFNSSSSPVLIVATTTDTSINITIYGTPDGCEYNIVSRLVKELPPDSPEYYYDIAFPQGEQSTIRTAKCGHIATSALQKFKHGKLLSTTALRQDTYLPVRAKIRIGGVEPMPLDITPN